MLVVGKAGLAGPAVIATVEVSFVFLLKLITETDQPWAASAAEAAHGLLAAAYG